MASDETQDELRAFRACLVLLMVSVLAAQTGYLMLSKGDVAGAQAMFEHASSRPQVSTLLRLLAMSNQLSQL